MDTVASPRFFIFLCGALAISAFIFAYLYTRECRTTRRLVRELSSFTMPKPRTDYVDPAKWFPADEEETVIMEPIEAEEDEDAEENEDEDEDENEDDENEDDEVEEKVVEMPFEEEESVDLAETPQRRSKRTRS